MDRTPEAVAVRFEDRSLTYRELDARANQLARHLAELGVGPDVPVGIAMERSPEMVVGLLGILKAGGAYVPLDPDYPAERLAVMLEDARVPVLLTQERLQSALPTGPATRVIVGGPRLGAAGDGLRGPAAAASGPGRPRLRDLHLGLDRSAQGGDEHPPRDRESPPLDAGTVSAAGGRPSAPEDPVQLRCLGVGALLAASGRSQHGPGAAPGSPGSSVPGRPRSRARASRCSTSCPRCSRSSWRSRPCRAAAPCVR